MVSNDDENMHKKQQAFYRKNDSNMCVIEKRYKNEIEEIITINELKQWTNELNYGNIDGIIQDIDIIMS